MSCYNLLNILKRDSDIMRTVFTEMESCTCIYDDFVQSLESNYLKDGSNIKPSEVGFIKTTDHRTTDYRLPTTYHLPTDPPTSYYQLMLK